ESMRRLNWCDRYWDIVLWFSRCAYKSPPILLGRSQGRIGLYPERRVLSRGNFALFSAPARALTPHLGDAATAHGKVSAGDIGGELAQEEGAAVADLVRAAVPAER